MASKSYCWDVRNIAKISPKMAKKNSHFSIFSIFSQTVHTIRTKASQKEKDLSRLLYRICGSGFFSRPFHENFKFLKNCPYDFHEILHSHSTPKGAPVCAKASKSYGLDVRNIAKISPKMAKKQPFLDFFRFSQKLSIRFERNFPQLFYTILESYMCNGIKIVWLGCEKHSQKWPKNSHFSTFFDFLKNCPYDSNEIFYSYSTPY